MKEVDTSIDPIFKSIETAAMLESDRYGDLRQIITQRKGIAIRIMKCANPEEIMALKNLFEYHNNLIAKILGL